jgi:hypothetical protein
MTSPELKHTCGTTTLLGSIQTGKYYTVIS